jgi:outer membrane protein insertion porin family/translocation and assembly module TamA
MRCGAISRGGRALLGAITVALALAAGGCVKKPYAPITCERVDLSNCVIQKVEVLGNHAVSTSDIKEKIATTETSRLFGGIVEHIPILGVWDRLLVDYERLDPFVLERDLSRIERSYRARGYYEAQVRAGRTIKLPNNQVRVEIVVDEGQPVHVAKVDLAWKDPRTDLRPQVTRAIETARKDLAIGAPFAEDAFEAKKKKLLRAMTDRGFAYAQAQGDAHVDLTSHQAEVVYTLELGPESKFGPITIEGNAPLPAERLLAAVNTHEGQRFSTAALESAELALTELGVFGSIQAVPQLAPAGQPRNPIVPVVFRVSVAPLHAAQLGGGAEIGGRVEVHLQARWEDKNFLGGLRHFSAELRPGVELYPLTLQTLFAPKDTVRPLPELRLRTELQQPGFVEARTTGVLSAAANLYRLPTSEVIPKDPVIVGYIEFAGRAGVERRFWGSRVNTSFYAVIQNDQPFAYRTYDFKTTPPGFTPITLPFLQTTASLDMRVGRSGKADKSNPHSGFYFQNDLQVMPLGDAGHAIHDVRVRPELRGYIPISKRWTLALRAASGLLFPLGSYGTKLLEPNVCASLQPTDPAAAACNADLQVLQFRAFFSGGANSNRGYPYNGVGLHQRVPLSNITLDPNTRVATGGLTLWEGSLELRAPIVGPLGTVLFVDGSNISPNVAQFDFTAPHLSAGFGLRYDTPVGPARLDLGVRIPCAQKLGSCSPIYDPSNAGNVALSSAEGEAGTIFGLPIAISIAIGEAF